MELRYRRKMKMPVLSLPGFKWGQNGLIGPSSNWQPDLGWHPQTGTTLPVTFNGNVDMSLGVDRQSAYLKWNGSGGSDYSGFDSFTPNITVNNPVKNGGNGSGTGGQNGNAGGGGLGNISTGLWVLMGLKAIEFGGDIANSFGRVKSLNDLFADAGLSVANGAGYQYMRLNDIDRSGELHDLKSENAANTAKITASGMGLGAAAGTAVGLAAGATAGGAFGPIGAGIGAVAGLAIGLIGSHSRKLKLKRRIYNAQQNAIRMNGWQNASAQTDYLTQSYYLDHDYTYDDSLYSAKEGKDAGEPLVQPKTMKEKVRLFNRKLTLPNMKQQ